MWPSPPYFAADDTEPHFVLEQIDDDRFHLTTPFVYRPTPPRTQVQVDSSTLPATDLASIPSFVAWFVGRHGRHTPAALVHDCLVNDARQQNDMPARIRADHEFLRALDELQVPPVRARIMWAAVTLGTRWGADWPRRIALLLWMIAAVAGIAALGFGIVESRPAIVLVAALGPLVGAVLWGRQYVAGVVGGYALWFIMLPTLACLAGYGVYWLVEQAVRLLRMLRNRDKKPLPGPPRFRQCAL